jgi:transcriptional regulator with XRE-family HTH domain
MSFSLQTLTELARNLRYLGMKASPDPATWAKSIAIRSGVSEQRVVELMFGAQPKRNEESQLAEAFGMEASELLAAPIYDVLKENLQYLLKSLPRGERKKLAAALGMTQSQLSRWATTEVRPEKANLRKLLKYLGLDPDVDLGKEPLFLSTEPVGGYAQKQWLLQRIQAAAPQQIVKHFATMEIIFKENATH